MASATYTQFVDAVQALTITGVSRFYNEPPRTFNSADMPCAFCSFPSGDSVPMTFTGGNEFRKRVVDLVVVYADTAVTADAPFTDTITMMDNLEAALLNLSVGQRTPRWEIRCQLYQQTADRNYWAVIATIHGLG